MQISWDVVRHSHIFRSVLLLIDKAQFRLRLLLVFQLRVVDSNFCFFSSKDFFFAATWESNRAFASVTIVGANLGFRLIRVARGTSG